MRTDAPVKVTVFRNSNKQWRVIWSQGAAEARFGASVLHEAMAQLTSWLRECEKAKERA